MTLQDGCTDPARLQPAQRSENGTDRQMNTNLWHEFDFSWESSEDDGDSDSDFSAENLADSSPPDTPQLSATADHRASDLLRWDSFILPDRREFRHSKEYREQTIVSYLDWVGSDPEENFPPSFSNESFKSLLIRRLDRGDPLSTLRFLQGVGHVLAQRLMDEGSRTTREKKERCEEPGSQIPHISNMADKEKITMRSYLGYCLDKSLWYMKGWKIRKRKERARGDSTVIQDGRKPAPVRYLGSLRRVRKPSRNQKSESPEVDSRSSEGKSICMEPDQVPSDENIYTTSRDGFYHHPGAGIGTGASNWGEFDEGLEFATLETVHPNGVFSLPELLSQTIPPNPPDTSRLPKFQRSLDNVGEVEEEGGALSIIPKKNFTALQTLASVPEHSMQSPTLEEHEREDTIQIEPVHQDAGVAKATESSLSSQPSRVLASNNTSITATLHPRDRQMPPPLTLLISNPIPTCDVTPVIRHRITRLERFAGDFPILNIIRPREHVIDLHLNAESTGTEESANRNSGEWSDRQKESQASSITEFEEDLEQGTENIDDKYEDTEEIKVMEGDGGTGMSPYDVRSEGA